MGEENSDLGSVPSKREQSLPSESQVTNQVCINLPPDTFLPSIRSSIVLL